MGSRVHETNAEVPAGLGKGTATRRFLFRALRYVGRGASKTLSRESSILDFVSCTNNRSSPRLFVDVIFLPLHDVGFPRLSTGTHSSYLHPRPPQPPQRPTTLHAVITMEGDQNITWYETAPYVPPAVVFPWGLAGPVTVSRSAQRCQWLLTFRIHRTLTVALPTWQKAPLTVI